MPSVASRLAEVHLGRSWTVAKLFSLLISKALTWTTTTRGTTNMSETEACQSSRFSRIPRLLSPLLGLLQPPTMIRELQLT